MQDTCRPKICGNHAVTKEVLGGSVPHPNYWGTSALRPGSAVPKTNIMWNPVKVVTNGPKMVVRAKGIGSSFINSIYSNDNCNGK